MAKPSILTRLTPGKIIDSFDGFVETFNFVLDFIENLRGDGDTNKSKLITIDRTVPDHPVIKGGGSSYVDNGCFRIKSIENTTLTLANCYCSVGGKTYNIGTERTVSISGSTPVVALRIDTNTSTFSSSVICYASFAEMAGDGEDKSYYIVPLYEFALADGAYSVKTDFRNIPTAAMYEFE